MFRRLYTRVREMDPFRADAILAGAFAVASVIEALLINAHGHSRALTIVGSVLLSATIAWRRRNTMFAVIAFLAVLLVQEPLDTLAFDNMTTPFIEILLLGYSVGRHEPSRRMWVEVALIAVFINVVAAISDGLNLGDLLWTTVLLGGPVLAGRGIRSRALLQREMRDKARRLEAERDVRAERAVEDERTRIASELQAVVANGVSAMVVQAGAVPRLIEAGDSTRASESLAVIEETGRDALSEMRRLLGVLRRDDDGPALAPQPTLARADALVARMGAEGLHAELTVGGEPVELSPGVDLAGYRVLQEALASARGADGVSHADVAIVYGDNHVTVTVRDDRPSPDRPDAAALLALRERVGLYGGVLRVAPRRSGPGFEVEARLPAGGPG
jgi:signal transduction histidine kinase